MKPEYLAEIERFRLMDDDFMFARELVGANRGGVIISYPPATVSICMTRRVRPLLSARRCAFYSGKRQECRFHCVCLRPFFIQPQTNQPKE